MEKMPVIFIANRNTKPEYRDSWAAWVREVYWPFLMKNPFLKEIATYRIVKESPDYNITVSIWHCQSLNELEAFWNSQEANAIVKDWEITWTSRGEGVWSVAYQLLRGFQNGQVEYPKDMINAPVESVPVIHLEGHRLPPEEEEKYNTWFAKWGYEVYVPLLMRLPGLKEYARYKITHFDWSKISALFKAKTPVEYPPYLSILTFDNIKAFENYERSLELAAYRSCMDAYFPRGLDFRWYVQYRPRIRLKK